jgi:hypothetical protein
MDKENTSSGVHAPRDPRAKGNYLYFTYQIPLEASLRPDGTCTDELDLDTGRLREKLCMMNGLTDEAFLRRFDSAAGFRSAVSAIGICVESKDIAEVSAEWILYGKKSRYGSGTHLGTVCPADGREQMIWLDDADWSTDDDTSGQLRFLFEKEGQTALATVLLYTRPGFSYPQAQFGAPPCFEGPAYEALLKRSLLSPGNNARLKRVFARAESGLPITMAFIGGSITQGAGARPIATNCYAYRAWKQAQALLATPVQFVKAGIGGTPSELGMIRFGRDILRKDEPDIVVIEFAVNDNDDETQGRCYESLVRQALSLPGEPAVLLLFSVFCDDWNLQERLAPIGAYYGLPMISVKDAVVPQFSCTPEQGGVIAKRQFFYDAFHPTNEGHRVMADCLTEMLKAAKEAPADSAAAMPEQSLTGRTFEGIQLIDRAHNPLHAAIVPGGFAAQDTNLQAVEPDDSPRAVPQFADNWMHNENGPQEPFVLRLSCKSLFLVEKDSSEDFFGKAEVFVDGRLCRTIDPHTVGWIHCGALLLFESDAAAEHEIRISMAQESREKAFTILGFGAC